MTTDEPNSGYIGTRADWTVNRRTGFHAHTILRLYFETRKDPRFLAENPPFELRPYAKWIEEISPISCYTTDALINELSYRLKHEEPDVNRSIALQFRAKVSAAAKTMKDDTRWYDGFLDPNLVPGPEFDLIRRPQVKDRTPVNLEESPE